MTYRIERDGSQVTIWNDKYGIGLRFQEGESLQRYNSAIVLINPEMAGDEAGMAIINQCQKSLTDYAAEKWPNEFKEIQ